MGGKRTLAPVTGTQLAVRTLGPQEAAIAQYNIEVRTRGSVLDTTKVESADLKGLRVEVARFVGRLLADHAEQIWVDEDWRVDGTDEKGLILFSLHLFATDSAATMYRRH